MRISMMAPIVAAAALLAASAHGADRPDDGRGQGNPGHVGKPGEKKSGPSAKDSARDATDKDTTQRGYRRREPTQD